MSATSKKLLWLLLALAFLVPLLRPMLPDLVSDYRLFLVSTMMIAAIAVLAARLYREHRFELDSLQQGERLVLYASIGLALLTFTATNRLFDRGGAGVLVWLALLALCSYGVFWVFQRSRDYG